MIKRGIYSCDDLSTYLIEVYDNEVIWIRKEQGILISIFKGTIEHKKLHGKWFEILSDKEKITGNLRLNISGNQLRKVYEDIPVKASFWQYESDESGSFFQQYSPTTQPYEFRPDPRCMDITASRRDLSGLWIDDTGGLYQFFHIDNQLFWILVPAAMNTRITYANHSHIGWAYQSDGHFEGNYYPLIGMKSHATKSGIHISCWSDHTLLLEPKSQSYIPGNMLHRVRTKRIRAELSALTILNQFRPLEVSQITLACVFFHTDFSPSSRDSASFIKDHLPQFYIEYISLKNLHIGLYQPLNQPFVVDKFIKTLPGFSPYWNEKAQAIELGIAVQAWINNGNPLKKPEDEMELRKWQAKLQALAREIPYRNHNRYSLMSIQSLYLTLFEEVINQTRFEIFTPCGLGLITRTWKDIPQEPQPFHLTLLDGTRDRDQPLMELVGSLVITN